MKIIFLDIDGVLNGYGLFTEIIYHTAKKLGLLKWLRSHHDIFGVHTRKVKLLAQIVKHTGARIVISSSWRFGWDVPYQEKTVRQKELIDKLEKYGLSIMDRTNRIGLGDYTSHRESEIREWLSRHTEVVSFVVLDDECCDLQGFVGKELVKTSEANYIRGNWRENTGLKPKHVRQAIRILNAKSTS